MLCALRLLDWRDFVSQVFSDQIQKSGTEFDDLLVRKTFALQLAVETLGDRFVAVYVEFF